MTLIGRIGTRLALGALAAGFALSLGIAASAPPPVHDTKDDVVRATLKNGLRVIIVPNTSGAGRRDLGQLSRGLRRGAGRLPRHGACAGAHDVPRQPGPLRRPARRHRQRHGRQFQRQYAREPDAVSLHRAVRGSRRRPAHRGDPHGRRARHGRRLGAGARRHRAGSGAGSLRSRLCRLREAARADVCGHALRARRARHAAVLRQDDGGDAAGTSTTAGTRRTTRSWSSSAMSIRRRRLPKIKALFGPIKAKKLPPRPAFAFKPPQAATYAIPTDRPNGTAMIAMRMPGLDSTDFPALEVLSDVLSSHRLRSLRHGAGGQSDRRDLLADPLPKASMALRRRVVSGRRAIPRRSRPRFARSSPRRRMTACRPSSVKAAIVQERREAEFQKNSIADLASVWSDAVALYGLKSPDDDLVRIEKVTLADVNRVARNYLDVAHASVAVLEPQGSGAPVAESHGFGGQEIDCAGRSEAHAPAGLGGGRAEQARRPAADDSTPSSRRLPNGLTLIVQPEKVSDTVSVYGHIRNRPETETPPGKEGVTLRPRPAVPLRHESISTASPISRRSTTSAPAKRPGRTSRVQVLVARFRPRCGAAGRQRIASGPAGAGARDRPRAGRGGRRGPQQEPRLARPARPCARRFSDKDDPSLHDATPETIAFADAATTCAPITTPPSGPISRPSSSSAMSTPEQARATIEKYFGGWTATGPKPDIDLPTAPPNNAGRPRRAGCKPRAGQGDPRPESRRRRAPTPTTTRCRSATPSWAAASTRRVSASTCAKTPGLFIRCELDHAGRPRRVASISSNMPATRKTSRKRPKSPRRKSAPCRTHL